MKYLFSLIDSTILSFFPPVPPEIETDNKKVAVDINQTAVLSCIAYSLPVPQFTWYKGSAPITSSDRVTISTRLDMPPYVSKLNISDVRMSDLGNYHCLAKNNLGMGNVTINLTVKSKSSHDNFLF